MERKHPLISVIMPCYNAARYLPVTMNSILRQTLPEIEIIAVDNGSRDKTYQVLCDYARKDPRVRLRKLDENQGVWFARNAALELAEGEYIAFSDSDDEVPPHAYRELYTKAKAGDYDVIVGSYEECGAEGDGYVHNAADRVKGEMDAFFEGGAVWHILFKKSFLDQNDIRFEPYNHGEDTLYLGRVYTCRPTVSRIPNVVYRYMHREEENSGRLTKQYDAAAVRGYVGSGRILYSLPYPVEEEEIFRSYYGTLRWIVQYMNSIPIFEERAEAFKEIKDFLGLMSWEGREEKLTELFRAGYSQLMKFSYGDYLLYLLRGGQRPEQSGDKPAASFLFEEARETVRGEFLQGKIGFRYIIKYAKAWLSYKLKRKKT